LRLGSETGQADRKQKNTKSLKDGGFGHQEYSFALFVSLSL
jgi:hypothetical protein